MTSSSNVPARNSRAAKNTPPKSEVIKSPAPRRSRKAAAKPAAAQPVDAQPDTATDSTAPSTGDTSASMISDAMRILTGQGDTAPTVPTAPSAEDQVIADLTAAFAAPSADVAPDASARNVAPVLSAPQSIDANGLLVPASVVVSEADVLPSARAQTFTAREAQWTKLGPVIDTPVTAKEAAVLGGLDFEVEKLQAAFLTESNGGYRVSTVASRRAMVRKDTGAFISFVSADYVPVQYGEAFDFIDAIDPQIISAGALKDGRQGFMVCKLPGTAKILGDLKLRGVADPHELHVVLRTSHDLSMGVSVALMSLRSKCMNQLTLPSLMSGAPQKWSIRHIGNPHQKLTEAKMVLQRAEAYAARFAEIATTLVNKPVTKEMATIVLKTVLPNRPKRNTQIESIITQAFDYTPVTIGEEFSGTAWGLVNAVDEYFEWNRTSTTRTKESMFTSGLDGDAHKYTGNTAQLLLTN